MQDSQTLKTEIITALDRLSLDSLRLLATFVSFLRTNAPQEELQTMVSDIEIASPSQSVQVMSPRLARREQADEFEKTIVEIIPDDDV